MTTPEQAAGSVPAATDTPPPVVIRAGAGGGGRADLTGPRTSIPPACGTIAAYQRHHRRKEQPCDACRAANAAYMRAYRAGYRPVAS